MKKRNRIVFIVLTFIVITSVQLLVNPTYSVSSEQKRKSSDAYPTSPEGVVKAFVWLHFAGAANEVIGDVKKQLQYTTWEKEPSSDNFCIALKYNVTNWIERPNNATVKVVYQVIGHLLGFELAIERGEEIVYYELLNDKGLWKISSPAYVPCISNNTAIKILEFEKDRRSKIDPKEGERMKKYIDILKKYL